MMAPQLTTMIAGVVTHCALADGKAGNARTTPEGDLRRFTADTRVVVEPLAGTIAGDDTLFIAPHKGVAPWRIARQLTSIWLEGASR